MKRSESFEYMTYASARSQGKYRKAFNYLMDFISNNYKDMNSMERTEIIQKLGEIYFDLGDPEVAEFFHKIAFDCQPNSTRVKLGYARFLCRQLKDYAGAAAICDEVIKTEPTQGSDEQLNYAQRQIQFATEIKEEIKSAMSTT